MDWMFDVYIIAIDTVNDNEIRVFRFYPSQIKSRLQTIIDVLKEIKWHQETNQWEHHKQYYDGDGSETLEL